jgi:hypothetical protein
LPAFNNAGDLLVQHDRQQILWDPADDGFVFSRQQVEQFDVLPMWRELQLAVFTLMLTL